MYVPEGLFKILISPDPSRQWQVYGNSPSPRSRKLGGKYSSGEDVGLNYAVHAVNGSKYATFTCFQCHAGMVAGKLVAGVGNAHIDQFALEKDLAEYKKIRDHYRGIKLSLTRRIVDLLADLSDEDIEHLQFFTLYSETILRPSLKRARSRGDDYGPYPVWQFMARMKDKPDATGFELYGIDDKGAALAAREKLISNATFGPVDRRPWWLRKHDVKSYVYGDTLASPASGKDFAINFTVPHKGINTTYEKRSEEISTILKFALQNKSPAFPKQVIAARVTKGAAIYDNRCSRCHGKFEAVAGSPTQKWILKYRSLKYQGAHPDWQGKALPDILYSAGQKGAALTAADGPVDPEWTVDTDLTYSRALQRWGGWDPIGKKRVDQGLTGHAAKSRSFFSEHYGLKTEQLPAVYNPTHDGYRAPPLVGIWASAPYLHNGSVPTLHALFEVTARPKIWGRVTDVSVDGSYDFAQVGLKHVLPWRGRMPRGPYSWEGYDDRDALYHRSFYDTSVPGYSNAGARTCGPALQTVDDKLSVIEFLKTLSDATVSPEGDKSQWGEPL